MATELRKTGISVIGDMPWGTHFCHFYETKQDLLDTLVPYFKAGLESKEFCVWVVSDSDLITVAEAKGALAQAVPGLDRHLAAGNIEVLNGLDWYLEKNVFNLEKVMSAWDAKLKRALDLGYEGMRVSGDAFWLREKDWKDFCAYEKQLNDSITDRHMNVLCTYPLTRSGAAEILDVAQTHQFAIARRRGEWEVIESLELIQAKAEIKRLNEALKRIIERTPKPSAILRYGMAFLSVTAALIIAMWMESVLQSAPHVSLFLCAVMLSAWFGGVRPGLLSIALSLFAFAYILPPNYSFAVETREIPRLFIFALSALFVALLSATQRNKAESLRHARDVLDGTVQELKRTNVALQAEITERKHAEETVNATSEQLRALSASLQSAREAEGSRIAREIHDELGSMLTTLKWDVEEIQKTLSTPVDHSQLVAVREKLQGLIKLTDMSVSTLRRIASELRPSVLDDLGLAAAIEWQTQQFQARAGITCNCDCPLENIELSAEQSTAVFRIFQEALTNVLRHARATRVDIKINEENGYFVLSVNDNGKGMKDGEISGTESLGLLGMRERAHLIGGEISITSVEGQGTVINLRLPIAGAAR
ncbi:MAG TPA: MEDS domain-containing protein [Pyrinomonadaceae bacterium]|nr:MEDS domain-containing protein [Pyrinomonadaceae bacterium]